MQYKILEYKRALQRLEHAAPELGVVAKEDCKGHQAAGPMCPCMSGGRVAMQGYPPWLLQTEELGFCAATCEVCNLIGGSRRSSCRRQQSIALYFKN